MKKRIFCVIVLAATLLCSCSTGGGADTTEVMGTAAQTEAEMQTEAETEPVKLTYYIGTPYKEEGDVAGETFETFNEGKAEVDKLAQYGRVLYSSEGEIVYNPCPTLTAAKILHHAKINADCARDNGYKYGDAALNPALDKTEKIVSCDRYVGWVLYDAGLKPARVPSTKGHTLYTTNNLEEFLKELNFEKIRSEDSVKAGDIVFVGNSQTLPVPGNFKDYPRHVFICAGKDGRRNYFRYDAGLDTRLQSTQPSSEPLSKTGAEFRFAYRAPADK